MPPSTRNGFLCGLLLVSTYWLGGTREAGVCAVLIVGLLLALGSLLGGWGERLVAGVTASGMLAAAISLRIIVISGVLPMLSP
jgi:hypothetical protein